VQWCNEAREYFELEQEMDGQLEQRERQFALRRASVNGWFDEWVVRCARYKTTRLISGDALPEGAAVNARLAGDSEPDLKIEARKSGGWLPGVFYFQTQEFAHGQRRR